MNEHHGCHKLTPFCERQILVIHGLHSEGAVSELVIYNLRAPVCNPWCVAAWCVSVSICEREFEKGSVTTLR